MIDIMQLAEDIANEALSCITMDDIYAELEDQGFDGDEADFLADQINYLLSNVVVTIVEDK